MIETFPPAELAEKAAIVEVYEDLAGKVLKKIQPYRLKCKYNGQDFSLDSEKNIYQFLTAEDFDSYCFSDVHRFLSSLLSLYPTTKLKTILGSKGSKAESIERFHDTYQGPEYQACRDKIENIYNTHTDWTIDKFKENLSPFLWTEEYRVINRAFSYENLTASARHKILTTMDVPVCPYCNMEYTLSYEKDREKWSTADLDHFYLKSEYPEYALCLYNFVPSCPVCNSKMKGNKSMTRATHLYPHSEEGSVEGEARFEVRNMACFLLNRKHEPINREHEPNELELKLHIASDSKRIEKINANEQVFQLNSRYQNFCWYAEEWLEKAQVYTADYMTDLEKHIHGSIDVKEMVFGHCLSEQEYGRRSLGKLKNDLLIQFGIFEDPSDDAD